MNRNDAAVANLEMLRREVLGANITSYRTAHHNIQAHVQNALALVEVDKPLALAMDLVMATAERSLVAVERSFSGQQVTEPVSVEFTRAVNAAIEALRHAPANQHARALGLA